MTVKNSLENKLNQFLQINQIRTQLLDIYTVNSNHTQCYKSALDLPNENFKSNVDKAINVLDEAMKELLPELKASKTAPITPNEVISVLEDITGIEGKWKVIEHENIPDYVLSYNNANNVRKKHILNQDESIHKFEIAINNCRYKPELKYLSYPNYYYFFVYPDFFLFYTGGKSYALDFVKNADLHQYLLKILSQS